VLSARNYAVRDANEAYDDLITRLDFFEADIVSALKDDSDDLKLMVNRAVVDRKQPCKVLNALRLKYFQDKFQCPIALNINAIPSTATDITDIEVADQFADYDNIFNDFHYDIGHGKGTGVGAVNGDAIVDGFGAGFGGSGPRGDSQTQ